ncbi:unnamed protein product [Urochloa humidicola]
MRKVLEAKTAVMRKGTAVGAGPGSRAAVLLLRSTPPRGHPFPRPAKSRRICKPLGGRQCRGGGGGLGMGTVEAGSTAGGPGRWPWSGNAGSEPPSAPSQDSVSPCRHQRLARAAQDAGGRLDRRAPARGNKCRQPRCHAMACCPVLSQGSACPPRVVFTSPHIVSSPSPTPSFPFLLSVPVGGGGLDPSGSPNPRREAAAEMVFYALLNGVNRIAPMASSLPT